MWKECLRLKFRLPHFHARIVYQEMVPLLVYIYTHVLIHVCADNNFRSRTRRSYITVKEVQLFC